MTALDDELRELAGQIGAIENEDVIDSAASIVTLYKRERMLIEGMLAVDAMVSERPEQIDDQHVTLVRVRERLRDRLKGLLAWARQTGRA